MMRCNVFFVGLGLILVMLPTVVFGGEYSVRPFLIDKVMEARDVQTETILLSNDSTYRKYIVYATVNEISIDKTGEIKTFVSPVMTDRTNTVTSWIEVTRGRIEIPPGEQREVPITFRIGPKVEPGEYHAFVGFVPASNRPTAENIAMAGDADGVVVKITIGDDREDSMRVGSFLIDRFVTGDDDSRKIEIEVENAGDITSAPTGEIVFYDSRGVEVAAVPVNTEGAVVNVGETAVLTAQVPVEASFGKYKANLTLKYGENQRAALYDTTFFYMMPLHIIILMFAGILFVALVAAMLFRRAYLQDDFHDDGHEVTMYVRDGHDAKPMDHDIDLKKTE